MEYDVFEKATAIMSERRAKAISENNMRTEEINAKIPQLKEVNNALFNTGRELVKLIGSRNTGMLDKKIEELKRYNLDAQELSRTLLVQNGYPSDYLDVHFNCPICNDTGYDGDKLCSCFKKLCGKLSADELNKKSNIKLESFDTFSLSYYKDLDYETMKRIFEFTKSYAENFNEKSGSIFMSGKTGLGKTHLSLAIAAKVLEKGYSVIYDSAINILRSIEREHFSRQHSSEMIDLVMNTDLLILDDLGTEYESTFYSATIYNILNSRLNCGKPTIISTNLDFVGISARYDERVVSRLVSVYTYLQFSGEDVRLQKWKNEQNNHN